MTRKPKEWAGQLGREGTRWYALAWRPENAPGETQSSVSRRAAVLKARQAAGVPAGTKIRWDNLGELGAKEEA